MINLSKKLIKAVKFMNIYSDFNIGSISVVVKKKETADFVFNCDSRRYDGFTFVTNGSGIFKNNKTTEKLHKNSLILLEKGEKYSVKALSDDFEYITTGYKIQPESALKTTGLPQLWDLSDNPYIANQIYEILSVWEERVPLYTLRTRVLCEQLLINLFDLHFKGDNYIKEENRLSPAITYINQYYDKAISSKTLSELCGMSVSNFRRVFKNELGMLPMEYREKLRIYWSKRLLKSGIFSVSEIATKLGYCDVYHFSKDFKKQTGETPKKYIKK